MMFITLLMVLCLGGAVQLPGQAMTRPADGATAEELLRRFDAASDPDFDPARQADEAYTTAWAEQRDAAWQVRYDAAVELARRYPDHPRVAEVLSDGMSLRYYLLAIPAAAATGDPGNPEAWDIARRQTHDELASWLGEPDLTPGVRHALTYVDLRDRLLRGRLTNEQIADVLPAIDELRKYDREDGRELLMWAARFSKDEQRLELLRRLATQEADTHDGKWAAGMLRREDAIGKPFEFAFDDLVTGKRVTSEELKGKVVVIDFWGTWCGICLQQMPDLMAAHEKYRGRGVEFIGVVMEDPAEAGARQKAIDYLKTKQVPWPQWYQEQGWDSDFALSYGISGLPAVFIVDAEGNLRSMNGRPDQELDTLLPELLAERDAAAKPE